MKLTQKQELLLGRYLQEVARHLTSLDDGERQRVIDRLKLEIVRRFAASTETTLTDEEVRVALARYGSPAAVAQHVQKARQAPGSVRFKKEPPRWLGVCAALAARLEKDVRYLRLACLVAGVITGPLALTLYLAVYFEMYYTSDPEEFPRIQKWRLIRSIAGTLAVSLALLAGSKALLAGMSYAYAWLMKKDAPYVGDWAWLELHGLPLFVSLLVCAVPLAVLTGLPLPNRWDATAKRIVQAALAVYALVLCLGIASALTGFILAAIEDLSGSHVSPAELLDVIKRVS